MNIPQNILDNVNIWLSDTFDNETQAAIKEMMTSSPKKSRRKFL